MALTVPVAEIVENSKNPLLGKHESWGRVLLGDIATIQNGLPPMPEQHRIVAEVERRLSLADEAEGQVNANHQRAKRLRQSILSRAFTGVSASSTIAHTTL